MEMRVTEDMSIGQDLTPPLPPLAFALHDSALNSHCSACFYPLPPQPFTPSNSLNPHHAPTILYCSPHCSSLDSSLHLSSGEQHLRQSPPSTWDDSSDLRLSLRLLHIFQDKFSRILSGSVNRDHRLFVGGNNENPFPENDKSEGPNDYYHGNENQNSGDKEGFSQNDVVFERIAGLMTNREKLTFHNHEKWKDPNENSEHVEGYEEVQSEFERIQEGAKAMEVARRMCLGDTVSLDSQEEEMVLCLVLTNAVEVHDKNGCSLGIAVYDNTFSWINHSCSPNACYRFSLGLEQNEEPLLKIFPAAIKNVFGNANGNDVIVEGDTKAPLSGRYGYGYGPRVIVRSIKAVNKGEEVTIAYTDLLQPKAVCTVNRDSYTGEEIKNLIKAFDDTITDYLSFSKLKSCFEKLESLLSNGEFDDQIKMKNQKLKLHPFHHVSLNAYTTLASAYKVYASDLLALDSDGNNLQAFTMCKLSAAYSLLLAGVSNHLFTFETSLMASVANFWIIAGESLRSLIKIFNLESSSILSHKCRDCSVTGIYGHGHCQNVQLEEINKQQLNCIANRTSKVWSSLASGSSYLGLIQNPIDFSWLQSAGPFIGFSRVDIEVEECSEQVRIDLVQLSSSCLRYGALLSSICYGFPLSDDM
ncbi:hypothetical protein RD792_000865 [Penstemon davidsonii]|uniref:SET domain-containing protein n=1 Tax=Penstemon davidsonii TaxID=160366 RepID=A0ABR0DN50_9LAMI|nr:hypothetical protein RD792_000865 [Penstemon davidsonii]